MADLARLISRVGSSEEWSRRRDAARLVYDSGHRPAQAAEQMFRALARFA
jgi:hypothetical protein